MTLTHADPAGFPDADIDVSDFQAPPRRSVAAPPVMGPPGHTADVFPRAPADFLAAVHARRFHAALGVGPSASSAEIQRALETQWNAFQGMRAAARGQAAEQLDLAMNVMRFVGGVLMDAPSRQLCEGVLTHQLPPAPGAQTALCEALRKAWIHLFPAGAMRATQQAKAALQAAAQGNVQGAHALGLEALAVDPFNTSLLEMVQGWRAR